MSPMRVPISCMFAIIALTGSDQCTFKPTLAGGLLSLAARLTSGLMRDSTPIAATRASAGDFSLKKLKSSSKTDTVMTHPAASPTTHAKLAVSASPSSDTATPSIPEAFSSGASDAAPPLPRDGSAHRGESVRRTTAVR